MGFVAMSEYSPGYYPVVNGIDNEYVNCSDAMSYRPLDVSDLKSSISEKFDNLSDDLRNGFNGLNDEITDLKDCWGTKFISINSSELGIVDVDLLNEYLDTFNNTLVTQEDKIMEIVDVIVSRTEEVNSYLQLLKANYDKYVRLKKEYSDCTNEYNDYETKYKQESSKSTPDYDLLSRYTTFINSLKIKLKELKSKMDVYENNELTSPDGSWVLG